MSASSVRVSERPWLTPSRLFLVFWLAVIGGLVLGRYFALPWTVILWLFGLWLAVWISGHEVRIELLALIITGLAAGFALWQLTGGEVWYRPDWVATISLKLVAFRDLLVDRIFLALPEPHGSLLAGILLGNRVKLDRDLIDVFRTVGLSHIIAVSGYNLTILTANFRSLTRSYLPRNIGIGVAFGLIVAFVLISGAPASILRAAVMSSTLLIGELVGRPTKSVNILLFTAGVLALFEPKLIFDIGFQLSLAATYALIRLTPLFKQAFRRLPGPEALKDILSETLAATLLTAPLILLYFERLSLVSPLTNLLVLPFIPLLMALGLVGAAVLLVSPVLGRLVTLLTWPILEWIIQVAEKAAALRFASSPVSLPIWALAVFIVALLGLTEWLAWYAHTRRRPDFELIAKQ